MPTALAERREALIGAALLLLGLQAMTGSAGKRRQPAGGSRQQRDA